MMVSAVTSVTIPDCALSQVLFFAEIRDPLPISARFIVSLFLQSVTFILLTPRTMPESPALQFL